MPDLPSLADHVADCVHCGLCLNDCPTYRLWGQEADSPRGRITLIDAALLQGQGITAPVAHHIDTCVGCMACVSACPAGVAFDRILEQARPTLERSVRRPAHERALRLLLFETLPYPDRLTRLLPALSAARRTIATRPRSGRLGALVRALGPAPERWQLDAAIPAFTPARGERRGQVGLLLGCVQRVFFSDVHRATVGLLSAEGYDVHAPVLPSCCGALELSAGEQEHGIARAQATIAAFAGFGEMEAIIVNAAGCGAAMKGYGPLINTPAAWDFAGRVRDVLEFLNTIDSRLARGEMPVRVAVHDACQLRHAQGVKDAPRELLSTVPGLELIELVPEGQSCCGAAGLYPVLEPEPAAALGQIKADAVLASGAEVVLAASPGCATQLRRHLHDRGHFVEVCHPVELLWRSVQSAAAQAASVRDVPALRGASERPG